MAAFLAYPPRPAPPVAPRALALALVVDLLLAVIVALTLSFLVIGALLAFYAIRNGLDVNNLQRLSSAEALRLVGGGGILALLALQNMVFVAIPLVRLRFLRREPLDVLGFTAAQPFRLLLFGIGLSAITLMLNAIVSAAFVAFGIRQNQAALYPLFAGDYLGQALFWVGAAIAVPIGEEVLFRGYVFGSLRRLAGDSRARIAAAYVLGALVFALFHIMAATEGVIGLLAPSFVIGLVLAWGFDRTGSLLPGMIAHAMNNSIAIAALLVCINNPGVCPQ